MRLLHPNKWAGAIAQKIRAHGSSHESEHLIEKEAESEEHSADPVLFKFEPRHVSPSVRTLPKSSAKLSKDQSSVSAPSLPTLRFDPVALQHHGLLSVEDMPKFYKLSPSHQQYLLSSNGVSALTSAQEGGRKINLEAFGNLDSSFLAINKRIPNPLFNVAYNYSDLSEQAYNDALINATECGLFDIAQKGDGGRNPIHVAALHGSVGAIKIFSAYDRRLANESTGHTRAINVEADNHYTPLEIVLAEAPGKAEESARALIDAGADLRPRPNRPGAINLAVKTGDVGIAKLVMKASLGEQVLYGKDGRGRTPNSTLKKYKASIPVDAHAEIQVAVNDYKARSGDIAREIKDPDARRFKMPGGGNRFVN